MLSHSISEKYLTSSPRVHDPTVLQLKAVPFICPICPSVPGVEEAFGSTLEERFLGWTGLSWPILRLKQCKRLPHGLSGAEPFGFATWTFGGAAKFGHSELGLGRFFHVFPPDHLARLGGEYRESSWGSQDLWLEVVNKPGILCLVPP